MPYKWEELAGHWATPGSFATMCEKDLLGDLRFRVGPSLPETQCRGCRIALIRLYAEIEPELRPPRLDKWELLLALLAEGRFNDLA